jgi:hypothetical protein
MSHKTVNSVATENYVAKIATKTKDGTASYNVKQLQSLDGTGAALWTAKLLDILENMEPKGVSIDGKGIVTVVDNPATKSLFLSFIEDRKISMMPSKIGRDRVYGFMGHQYSVQCL